MDWLRHHAHTVIIERQVLPESGWSEVAKWLPLTQLSRGSSRPENRAVPGGNQLRGWVPLAELGVGPYSLDMVSLRLRFKRGREGPEEFREAVKNLRASPPADWSASARDRAGGPNQALHVPPLRQGPGRLV
jgi:hypothetical protein